MKHTPQLTPTQKIALFTVVRSSIRKIGNYGGKGVRGYDPSSPEFFRPGTIISLLKNKLIRVGARYNTYKITRTGREVVNNFRDKTKARYDPAVTTPQHKEGSLL